MPAANQSILREGPVITRTQQLELIADFSKEEVLEAIQSIDDNRAPGGDGFNAHFFKKAWPTIGNEVTNAILQFFHTCRMYEPINRTSVPLIPKVKHPSSIKEYRLISCSLLFTKSLPKCSQRGYNQSWNIW